jgi:DNA modification methylase
MAVIEKIGNATLYLGDCAEILPTLSKVDAVITDPPYGISITKSARLSKSRGFKDTGWDSQPPSKYLIDSIIKKGKQAILWGGNYFDLPPTRCFLAWDKQNEGRDFADLEMAWTNLDKVARIFRMRPMNMDGGKVHPTQKPISLMEWCIDKVEGNIILDPFMGSGSTGVACAKMGKEFIGIERDEQFFEIAYSRIKMAYAQGDMFI